MSKTQRKIYFLATLVLVLWGAHAWFTWEWGLSRNSQLITFGLLSIPFFGQLKRVRTSATDRNIIIASILMFLACVVFKKGIDMMSYVIFPLQFFCLYVLALDIDKSNDILDYITKFLSVIIIMGLVIHIPMMFTGMLPSMIISYPDNDLYVYFNYIVAIQNIVIEDSSHKFFSIFLEPAYLATMCVYLLYATSFNFKKWQTYVLIAGIGFSLSLAGYITGFLAYILCSFSKGKNVKRYVVVLVVLAALYNIAINYNNGDNYLNTAIVERLQPDEEKGIVGNNRTGEFTRDYFEYYVDNGEIFLGLGSSEISRINGGGMNAGDYSNQIRGAGYMVFFLKFGVLAAILFFLVYYFIGPARSYNKKYAWGFLFIICITFVQASYPTSYSWIIPYILGINGQLRRDRLCLR